MNLSRKKLGKQFYSQYSFFYGNRYRDPKSSIRLSSGNPAEEKEGLYKPGERVFKDLTIHKGTNSNN